MLGTQCPAQGLQLGICPENGDVLVTHAAAATVPPAASTAPAAGPRAATIVVAEPAVPAFPAAPEKTAATLSAHDLIEASHELLQAQAERPLLRGSLGADGDARDRAGRNAAVSPAPLAYAAAPPIRAETDTALPSAALPDETETTSNETSGVGGPLLPPLPEPEPLSLPLAGPEAGETPEMDAPEAPDAVPVATAVRIGDSRVNVRAGPSTADARLFGLDPGEQVMATETSAGWMKIEDAAGRVGWVLSELLAGADDDVAAETAAAATAATAGTPAATTPAGADIRTVSGTGVSVREDPSNSGARLFALAAGEDVTVTGSDKGWLQIVDSRGRTGWAYSDFLAPKP